MPEFRHPGVYVSEKPSEAKPIEAASTSTACFAGTTVRGRPDFPKFVTSWFQFRDAFGDLDKNHDLPLAVYHFFQNGGSRTYILRVVGDGAAIAADVAARAADQAGAAAAGKSLPEIAAARQNAADNTITAAETARTAASTAATTATVLAGKADAKTAESVAAAASAAATTAKTAATTAKEAATTAKTASERALAAAKTADDTANAAKKDADTKDKAAKAAPGDATAAKAAADAAKAAADAAKVAADAAKVVADAAKAATDTAAAATKAETDSNVATARATALSVAAALAKATETAKTDPTPENKTKVTTATTDFANAMTELDTAGVKPAAEAASATSAAAGAVPMILSAKGNKHAVAIAAVGKGEWGNGIKITVTETKSDVLAAAKAREANIDVPLIHFDLEVSFAGQVVETWGSLDGTEDGSKFYASVINRSSSYIKITPNVDGSFVQGDADFLSATNANDGGPKPPRTADILLAGGSDGKGVPTSSEFDVALGALDRVSDVSLLVVPGADKDTAVVAASYVAKRAARPGIGGDLFYIMDPPRGDGWNFGARDERESATQISVVKEFCQTFPVKNTYTGLYFPWIQVADVYSKVSGATRFAPPSGMIAGLFARTDNTRGVWKAPAGTEASMLGALGVAAEVSDQDQDELNPIGVNCIRKFAASGIVCWGTRTLGTLSNPEFRYVPVRRTANFLKTSLYKGTQWVVFEPNDEPLWSAIRFNLNAFMSSLFRAGAFQGSKPEEAFFVKCDKDNNRQATIDQGQVHILVGWAPLKPAEFVIIELQQMIKQ